MKPIRRRVKLETGEVVAVAAWPAGSLKLTLGPMKRLEFSGISSEEFQKIQTDFADTEKSAPSGRASSSRMASASSMSKPASPSTPAE
jgi:hypothetical protein